MLSSKIKELYIKITIIFYKKKKVEKEEKERERKRKKEKKKLKIKKKWNLILFKKGNLKKKRTMNFAEFKHVNEN